MLFPWSPSVGHPILEQQIERQAVKSAICHFDYHPINVMVEGDQLNGILDFSLATFADRRIDIGITQTFLDVGSLLYPMDSSHVKLLSNAWQEGYKSISGDFPLEPIFHAWAACYLLNRYTHYPLKHDNFPSFFNALEKYVNRLISEY